MVSEPSPHVSTASTMISITTEGELGPARDLDAKFDKLMSMIEGSEKRIAQEMQALKLAIIDTIRPDITAAAPALGVGGPSSGPGSSATSGASPVYSDTSVGDTTGHATPTPTRCSTEVPSRGASELSSPSDSTTAPSSTVDIISELDTAGLVAAVLPLFSFVLDEPDKQTRTKCSTECSVDHANMVMSLFSLVPVSANSEDVDAHKLFEERPPQIKFEGEAWFQRLQLKPPWPSVTLISKGSGVSCHIWEMFKQCNPTGHIETTFHAPELHMPRLVGSFCTSPTCGSAKDQYNTSRTWYCDDEILSVKQGRSNIKEVQRVSVFLDTSVGSWSCVPGIPIQIFGTCSALKLLSSCSAFLIMENFLEDSNSLKCLKGQVQAKAIAVDQVQSGSDILYVTNGSGLACYMCTTQIMCIFSWQQVHGKGKLLAQPAGDLLCICISRGYEGGSVNYCLLWASEQDKLMLYSANGHVHHMMLQTKRDEMHQLVAQTGKCMSLFLQLKPPWLSILTHVYIVVEEREVYPNRKVITLNSKIIFAALGPYVQQLIDDCLLRTLYQEERYSSCSMVLSEAKALGETCGILIENRSRLVFGILGVQVTWSAYYSLSDCTCEAHWKQGCGEFLLMPFSCGGENQVSEQLFKKNLGGASFFSRLLQEKGLARYTCSIRVLPHMKKTLFEICFACVLPVCTDINMERSMGSHELFPLPASYPLVECFAINIYGSDISSNSGHYLISKAGFLVAKTENFLGASCLG